jgi:pimeloyl-ACP methyl ester carboxylesterase
MGFRSPFYNFLHDLPRLKNAMYMYEISGINVVMVDYRGYGMSSGTPTETGLNLDGDAVLRFAVNHPRYFLDNLPTYLDEF